MQLFSYITIYTFCFIFLHNMSICFPQYIPALYCFLACFITFFSKSPSFFPCFTALMMLAQPSWARICLNFVFMLRSTCQCAPCMLMLRSLSLYALCHVHVSRSTCWLLCHVLLKPFISCYPFLSCVLAFQESCRSRSCGLGLHLYTQDYMKGFGSLRLCMSMLDCFYALSPYFPIQIQALPCFLLSMGLCSSVFGATCLCGCIRPSYGFFRCDCL